jgi:DNA-binding CsgD family transcriptional regulator
MTAEQQISEREREILRLVAMGATNQQIANQLNISVNTVKVHLRNIFGKIGVASRTEATMYAVRTGIVDVVMANGAANMDAAPAQAPEAVAPRETFAQVVAEPVVQNTPPPPAPKEIDERDPTMPADSQRERKKQLAARSPAEERRQRLIRDAIAVGTTLGALAIVGIILWLLRPAGSPSTNGSQPTPTTQVFLGQQTPTWASHRDLSAAQAGAVAASYNGRIFLLGGGAQPGVSGALSRYDPTNETVTPLTAKPMPVKDIQAVVLNGKIYVRSRRRAGRRHDQR